MHFRMSELSLQGHSVYNTLPRSSWTHIQPGSTKIEASDTFLLGYVGACVASRAKQCNVLWLLHSFLE